MPTTYVKSNKNVYVKSDGKVWMCGSCKQISACAVGYVPESCPNCNSKFNHVRKM